MLTILGCLSIATALALATLPSARILFLAATLTCGGILAIHQRPRALRVVELPPDDFDLRMLCARVGLQVLHARNRVWDQQQYSSISKSTLGYWEASLDLAKSALFKCTPTFERCLRFAEEIRPGAPEFFLQSTYIADVLVENKACDAEPVSR